MRKRTTRVFIAVLLLVGVFHYGKPMPEGVDYVGSVHYVPQDNVTLYADTTVRNEAGEHESKQEVFDEVMRMIENADSYVLVDFFLYNDFLGIATSSYRQLSSELTDTLIAKKESNSDIVIQVISDPINTLYGGYVSKDFTRLREADIPVIETSLPKLRDSNPLYGSLWRTLFQWFGNSSNGGWLPNPLAPERGKLTLRTYLRTLNFKANHRKVVVADYMQGDQRQFATLVTSANPHDGSSRHSNMAIKIIGDLYKDVLVTEGVVAALGEQEFHARITHDSGDGTRTDDEQLSVQLFTEQEIRTKLIAELDVLRVGESVDIAMFYIADRKVVRALRRADDRGVRIRLLLDPSKDAFGREKNGQPNRQVAHELMDNTDGNTEVRWCNTYGEQCHSKMILIKRTDGTLLLQGSANLTKRNIGGFNLETDVLVQGKTDAKVFKDVQKFFDMQWHNEDGRQYSVPYATYADAHMWRLFTYRLKEWSGLSRW